MNILSGIHGFADGTVEPDVGLLDADIAEFGGISGVTVHNITTMGEAAITNLLRGAGTTIGAFCNSGVCLGPFR